MSRKPKAKRKPALGRVLIVEDDPVLALSLEDALHAGCNADVVICPSMEATMSAIEEQWPETMIIDIHLADRNDGWALADRPAWDQTPAHRLFNWSSAGHPGRDCRDGGHLRKTI
jgi:CheY-like chemotaxis protein